MRMRFKHSPGSLALRLVVLALLLTSVWIGCTDQADQPTGPAPVSEVSLSVDNPRAIAAMSVQERHTPDLMSRDGVVGTGVGMDAHGNAVVLILAERPGIANLPTKLEGIPTRVDVVGEVVPLRSYKGEYRPVPGGVSVGNANECVAGSVGAIVIKGGTRHILSNNHVLARMNAASIGERINQPGRYDGKPACVQTSQCGTLSGFVSINFSGGNNTVDVATASLSVASSCAMVDNLYTPSSTVVNPSVGLAVKKVGRTSGLTTGTIAGINVTVNVNYGSPGVAKFVNQIYVASNFIRSGDSGSMMVTQNGNNPVGLNFAGGSGASFANPIGPALQGVGASICGQ